MNHSLEEIIGDPVAFLDQLFAMIEDIELDVKGLAIDHICYRVVDNKSYLTKKNELLKLGVLITESEISGRPISIIRLNSPIIYRDQRIELIELPHPKENNTYVEGLEHAEFVTKEPLEKIIRRYPQYSFQTYGMHKKINADITLKLGNISLRFHNNRLDEIIKTEKQKHDSKYSNKK